MFSAAGVTTMTGWLRPRLRGPAAAASESVNSSSEEAVPEPKGLVLLLAGSIMGFVAKRR